MSSLEELSTTVRNCISFNDWIVIYVNVIFFVVVQTLFFRYIASKQYENVLKQKVEIIKIYGEKFPKEKVKIDEQVKEYLIENNDKIQDQQNKRSKKNAVSENTYCWNFLKVISVLLLITLYINKEQWTPIHTLGLIFVVLGYTTEILFFFLIVQKYEFVGDHTITSEISKQLI